MNKKFIATIAAIFLTAAVAVGFFVANQTNVPTESSAAVVPAFDVAEEMPDAGMDPNGTWAAEENGSQFVATVSNEIINIQLVNGDTSVTYWNGTFQISPMLPGQTIVSTVLDSDTVVLSSADSKNFYVEQDGLIFDFVAMGLSTKVRMTRAA